MLQFPGATGRVKLVHEVEIEGQQIAALLVVLPHSVAVVDAESSALLKAFDFQGEDHHHTINDAVYVHSIRSILVAFRDGTLALIPPSCVEAKLLPRVALKDPICSLCVVGDDAVIGWSASGAVCEVPVYAGKIPEDSAAGKKISKDVLKAAEDSARIGCVLQNTGVVTADSGAIFDGGSIGYNYVHYSHVSSKSLLASHPVLQWMTTDSKFIPVSVLTGDADHVDASWRVVSMCPDPITQGAVLLLLACCVAGEQPKSKKKSNEGTTVTETAHYIAKVAVATNSVMMARRLACPCHEESIGAAGRKRVRSSSDSQVTPQAVHLLAAGTIIWIVWSTGVCSAFNSRHGVPVILPMVPCTDSPTPSGSSAMFTLPTSCHELLLNHGSCRDSYNFPTDPSGDKGFIVSLTSAALQSSKSSFLLCALRSHGGNVTQWRMVVSLFDGANEPLASVENKYSSYKPTSLCAAIGSLTQIVDKRVVSAVEADVSNGVLAALPRTCKRRLNNAQSMLSEELNHSMYSNNNKTHSAPVAVQTPDVSKKAGKRDSAVTDLDMARDFQYVGMGRLKSTTKAYLSTNIDAVEAFVQQLDQVLAAPDGISYLKSSDWSVLQAVLRTETISIQKRPTLLKSIIDLQRLDVIADILQYVPDLSEAQALSLLMFSVTSADTAADRYCLHHGRLKARGRNDTTFIKANESLVAATPLPIENSFKKSVKKNKKNDLSEDKIALLNRSCAFPVPSLITAARVLSQDAASIILSAFTSLLDGHVFSVCGGAVNDELMDNFNDRQVSLALNWIEALLDSHYSGFAMALSNKYVNTDKQANVALVAATVLRKLFTMTVNAEQSLNEMEAMFGLWTHVSRSAKSGVAASVGLANGAVPMGATGGAEYQVETLEL